MTDEQRLFSLSSLLMKIINRSIDHSLHPGYCDHIWIVDISASDQRTRSSAMTWHSHAHGMAGMNIDDHPDRTACCIKSFGSVFVVCMMSRICSCLLRYTEISASTRDLASRNQDKIQVYSRAFLICLYLSIIVLNSSL